MKRIVGSRCIQGFLFLLILAGLCYTINPGLMQAASQHVFNPTCRVIACADGTCKMTLNGTYNIYGQCRSDYCGSETPCFVVDASAITFVPPKSHIVPGR